MRKRREEFILHPVKSLRLLAGMALGLENALLLLLELLALGDITGDLRCPDDPPAGIADGRNRQRNIDQLPVTAATARLEMIYFFSVAQSANNFRLFIATIRRNDQQNRLANRLGGGISK